MHWTGLIIYNPDPFHNSYINIIKKLNVILQVM